jgi:hypothetical protein
MTGRNRPRKWRKDEKWKDPNLTNPQIEGGVATNGFFPEGNTFPLVAAGYGAANPQDVPGTSEGITWEDRVAYAALLGGGAKALSKIDNMRPPPGGPTVSNGIGGMRRKDVLKEAMSKSQGARVEDITQPSRRGDPTLNATVDHSALRENMIKAGVTGAAIAPPAVLVAYNWYASEQYKKGQTTMSLKEFVAAMDAQNRQAQGLPGAPSVKPNNLPQ